MTRWRRFSVVLGLALCAACTESHGGAPRGSTETGNPPVIDISAVALVVRSSEVHIVGAPGAVRPGGIDVKVDNLQSGDEQRGPVAADGSFDVQVTGSPDDTYAVRAIGAAASAVSAPVYVHRGGASVEEGLSCEQRADVIEAELAEASSHVDLSCSSNADCTQLVLSGNCPRWACGGSAASWASRAALTPALEGVVEAWCEPFERDDCFFGMPSPSCTYPGPFACIDRQCKNCVGTGCERATCEPCTTPRIEWTLNMGPSRRTYALNGCKTLSAPGGCSSEPPCIVSRDSGDFSAWSIADLQNMLGAPSVQAALADEMRFGALTPGGFFTEIRVGDRSFIVSDTSCQSAQDCSDPPLEVYELAHTLPAFAEQYTCEQ